MPPETDDPRPMHTSLEPKHRNFGDALRAWAIAAASAAAPATLALLPRMPQDPAYHDFADSRALLGIPNALNTVSNVSFAVVGIAGVLLLRRNKVEFRDRRERWPWLVLFVGVTLTSVGSAWYHLAPSNGTLVCDRLPMAMGFMALLAAVVAERVSPRIALRLLGPLVIAGVASVLYWYGTEATGSGDLRPYLLVQFFPLLAIPLLLLLFPPAYDRTGDYALALAMYAVAKLAESADALLFDFARVVSGHTVKHVVAAAAVGVLVRMLGRRTTRQPSISP